MIGSAGGTSCGLQVAKTALVRQIPHDSHPVWLEDQTSWWLRKGRKVEAGDRSYTHSNACLSVGCVAQWQSGPWLSALKRVKIIVSVSLKPR